MRLFACFVLVAVPFKLNVDAFQSPNAVTSMTRRSNPLTSPRANGRRGGFLTVSSIETPPPITRLQFSQKAQEEEKQQQEEALSDVDARVLREMLQESKLDLQTEDDVKKLLERGTVKSTVNPKEQAQKEKQKRKEESLFDSTILQTFTDTKLWKKVSAQTADLLESAKIWVANKVEQDLQVAAALGLFAWERAVRDVSRALPATASVVTPPKPKVPLSLSNTSSYQEPEKVVETTPKKSSLRDDFSRPEDEIKDVSRAIWGILQGDQTAASSQRGLRSVAKAGTANVAERQRRAFTQRRRLDRRDKDLTRVAGSVVDTAYELQRELKAETSQAGYKTKPLRQAIAAGTAGVLSAVQETARLAAAKRQETLLLKQAAANRTVVYTELVVERASMLERLSACIDAPQNSWLAAPDETLAEATRQMTENQLREVASLLVVLRNDMKSISIDSAEEETTVSMEQVQEVLLILRADVQALHELGSRVDQDVSAAVANALYNTIVGIPPSGRDDSAALPLLLRLDQVEASVQPPPEVKPETVKPAQEAVFFADAIVGDSGETIPASWAAEVPSAEELMDVAETVMPPIETAQAEYMDAVFVDVAPEVDAQSLYMADSFVDDTAMEDESAGLPKYRSFVAEVVSDEDVDTAFGGAKEVRNLSEDELAEEEVEEEPNVLVLAALRTLDVLFFVLEKSFTVALPATIQSAVTAAQRYGEVQRSGQGREGWETLRRSADAKGRY